MVPHLDIRDQQILHLTGFGLTSKEMASFLSLSTHTVDWYRHRMNRLFNVTDKVSLLRAAIAAALLRPDILSTPKPTTVYELNLRILEYRLRSHHPASP